MDPLAKAYLKVITESDDLQNTKDPAVKGFTPKKDEAFGDSKSDSTVKKFISKSGTDVVDGDIEDPEEAPADLQQQDGDLKKNSVSYESKNPFDALYAKILSEEGEMDFSTASNPSDSTFEPSTEGDEDMDHGFDESDDTDDTDDMDDEVTITLDRETAQKLIDVLQAAIGGGEGEEMEDEDHEGEEMEDEDHEGEEKEGEEENPFKEETDIEAFSDEHGLKLLSKNNNTGGVKVTKKTAEVPHTGKGHDGKLKPHSTEGGVSKLTSKASYKTEADLNPGEDFFK